jgi:hypothetical protein
VTRWTGAAVLAAVLTVASCSGDERDTPDPTSPVPVGSLTVAPAPSSSAPGSSFTAPCDGSAPTPSDLAACRAGSSIPATDPTEPADVPGSTHGGDSPTESTLPRCEDPDDATDPEEPPCVP